MDAYSSTFWGPAFTAIAGSSAALTGLLFVAISINLSQIIKVPGLVPRAIEVLVLLTAVLILSTLMLMPSQSAATLGSEALAIAVIAEIFIARIQFRASRHMVGFTPVGFAARVFGSQLGVVLLTVGGVSLLAETAGGLYWIVPGMLAAMISAIIGAWVLLVEILR